MAFTVLRWSVQRLHHLRLRSMLLHGAWGVRAFSVFILMSTTSSTGRGASGRLDDDRRRHRSFCGALGRSALSPPFFLWGVRALRGWAPFLWGVRAFSVVATIIVPVCAGRGALGRSDGHRLRHRSRHRGRGRLGVHVHDNLNAPNAPCPSPTWPWTGWKTPKRPLPQRERVSGRGSRLVGGLIGSSPCQISDPSVVWTNTSRKVQER